MALGKLLASNRSRVFIVLSILGQAARELLRGDYKVGSVLIGLAFLAYRSTIAGIAAQIALWWYRKQKKTGATADASAETQPV